MPSRKALVAAVLLLLIVPGGVLLGLARLPSPSAGPASPSTQNIGPASAGAGWGALGPAVVYPSGQSYAESASTTTTTVMTTTIAAGGTASVATSQHGGTTLVTPNQPQGSGASLSPASAGSNGSRDIEFFSNVTVEATSASSAFAKATAIAYSVGGYVADSAEDNSSAVVVMRVPAASDQDALSQVEALGTLVALGSSSNDVTVQYTDLNATLQSLQAEEASLLAILGQSTNINTTLSVEDRIQQVDQQINSVQSEILQTKTLVSFATISLVIQQRAAPQPLSIKVTSTPRRGNSPLSVTFNAVVKGGEQPYIVNYNFGDGSSYEGQALIHTFGQPGRYNVTVTATDASANVTEGWTVVDVSAPPAGSSFGGFPSLVGGLFLQVVEGMAEVAVVVLPIAGALLVVLLPLRHRLAAKRPDGGSREEAGRGRASS